MLVETHSLSKHYGKFHALRACDLSVARGEIFGLLGPNGAGKTTLLRLLMGFLRPSSGHATIDGIDCYRQRVKVHQRVTYLPGDARLHRAMRGRDVLRFFSAIRPENHLDHALQMADRLELDLSRRVGFMSTGMRQKLALAVTMSAKVPLVILDEPTANLDPTVRGEVIKMVQEARDDGQTVMFSSHVLSEVEESCDRVVILRAGRLVHTQVMSDLRRSHRIFAKLHGPLPEVPEHLADQMRIVSRGEGQVMIETPNELSTLMRWLAGLPLDEIRIEPVGLRAVYDRFHADPQRSTTKPPDDRAGSETVDFIAKQQGDDTIGSGLVSDTHQPHAR